MEENKRITNLFERARTEAPKTSFESVKGHFLATSAVAGTGLLAKWAALSFKLKVLIMTSTLIILTISGLVISSNLKETTTQERHGTQKEYLTPQENLEITQEDGVRETIFYDNEDQVVEIIVDSSEKLKELDETLDSPQIPTPADEPMVPKVAQSSLIQPKAPETDTNNSKMETSSTVRRFEITENTTEEELNEIRKLAQAAGITMKYNARIKRNIIKRISMTWILECEGRTSNWSLSVSGDDDFSVEVGWEENEKGQAISFLSDKHAKTGKSVEVSTDGAGTKVEVRN